MSALAARRAAQKALASKSASASPAPSPAPAPRKKASKAPSPDLEAEYDTVVLQSDSNSEEDDAPPKRRRVGDSGGRGRGGKGKQSPREKAAPKEAKLRYYGLPEPALGSESEAGSDALSEGRRDAGPDSDAEADECPLPAPKGSGKRPRRFSFSVPNGMSSGGEDEGEEGDDPMLDGRADGAATPWSVQSPGPSQFSATLLPASSEFVVHEGVNVHRVPEKIMTTAGLAGAGVAVSLAEGESLMIVGTYRVTPLQRPLGLLSTVLHPDGRSHPVFAPTSHPVPVLSPGPGEEGVSPSSVSRSSLIGKLKIPKSFARDSSRTIFLLQKLGSGIDGLRGDCVSGFGNIWRDGGAWGLNGVHPVVGSFPVVVYPHVTPPSWGEALSTLSSPPPVEDEDGDDGAPRPPVVLVKGPKRSGKSSLARAALNVLLESYERVAWLECDLGQGEFTPSGVVGLWVLERPVLGPPFTHPALPASARFLGEITPQSCPDEYIAYLEQLVQHYSYEVQFPLTFGFSGGAERRRRADAVPLVVNTQGWVKGLGEDLLRAIEGLAAPSHVFGFETERAEERAGWTASPVLSAVDVPPAFQSPWEYLSAGVGNGPRPLVRTLEPAPSSPLQARYAAADLRNLAIISYMHARIPAAPTPETAAAAIPTEAAEDVRWDFSVPLVAVPPLVVDVGDAGPLCRAYLIGEGGGGVLPPDLPLALNASLVGLLAEDEFSAAGDASEGVYVPGRLPGDGTLLGLALVRAVRVPEPDVMADTPVSITATAPAPALQLQVLSPLPAASLAHATALVRNGALTLPTCGMLDWAGAHSSEDGIAGTRWRDVPFFEAPPEGVGAQRRRIRRNLQRRG